MRALLIDNESNIRHGLHDLLHAFCPEITAIHEADSVINGINAIALYSPDIVFLDVELDDGTGFDLLSQLQTYNFQLIFITAHDKYAINAFKFSAMDFLLKPVDPGELQRSVSKAYKNINNDPSKQLAFLLEQIKNKQELPKKIILKDIHKTYYIKIEEILYCEADGIYTKFVLVGQAPILVSKNLKEYENLLEPLGFVRTHHSYLVNPEKIRMFDKSEGGMLILEEGTNIPVSQRKKESVLKLLEQ